MFCFFLNNKLDALEVYKKISGSLTLFHLGKRRKMLIVRRKIGSKKWISKIFGSQGFSNHTYLSKSNKP